MARKGNLTGLMKTKTRNQKDEIRNKSELQKYKMTETQYKQFDLEERTFKFARDVRAFVKTLPKTLSNIEDISQLIRSSGSVGANYIEANESLSKKDFIMRIKISRKEAKESNFWLRLVDTGNNQSIEMERQRLCRESLELMNIFGSIIRKSESNRLKN